MENIKQYLSLLALILFFGSCTTQDEIELQKEQIAATWQLESLAIDGQQVNITGSVDIIQFLSTQVFKRYYPETGLNGIGGWSLSEGMLNISIDLPVAYYIESLNASSLVIKSYSFAPDGKLITTTKTYKKVNDELILF